MTFGQTSHGGNSSPISSSKRQDSVRDARAQDRQRMLRTQLNPRGIRDDRVLDAMADVPREQFVNDAWQAEAYSDGALPISCGQTISQPYTVAFMCEAAEITSSDRILEIGTGSGYGAAVLSRLGRKVYTVERIPELAESARERLAQLGYDNVEVHVGDGTLGLPKFAPYDVIIVTAGAGALPVPLRDQLAEGGRMVIPVGTYQTSQTMYRYRLRDGKLVKENLGAFAFVPLIGEWGWQE